MLCVVLRRVHNRVETGCVQCEAVMRAAVRWGV